MITDAIGIDAYHRAKHVSHSKLKTLASKGPRGYFMAHVQGSWREDDKDSYLVGRALEDAVQRPRYFAEHYVQKPAGMNFGSKEGKVWRAVTTGTANELDQECAALARILRDAWLGPDYYANHYAAKPEGMSFANKEGKAWKAEQGAKTILSSDEADSIARLIELLPGQPQVHREVLDADDMLTVQTLVETLDQCPIAKGLIAAAEPQLSIMHDRIEAYPELPGMQARPDWLCLNGCAESGWRPFTLDLKSTLTLPELSSGRSILKYGYHSQAANVETLLKLDGVDVADMRHFLLGAEKTFPHRWRVIELPRRLVSVGDAWCKRQLSELNGYYARGEWPLVPCELVEADVPRWLDDAESEEAA